MLSFASDYTEGAHPQVLRRLVETNMEQLPGYCTDHYCISAMEKIRAACQCPEADVYLLTGGTQTNAIVIDTMLDSCEGVVCAATGHVNIHEAGAIEHSGHKVLPLPEHQGKLDAEELRGWLADFYQDENHEHMVFPGMVYLSHPTEYGTLYTREELAQISSVCADYRIPLYIDGARLGYGLASRETDLTLPDIAGLCDAFYIGGTKVGALCGEAVVFPRMNAPARFMTKIKQRGALLAKGRLLGVQFDALFTDNLYLEISKNAIEMAELMKKGLRERNYPFHLESPTNQQFVVLENRQMERLKEMVDFSFWEKAGPGHTVVRFAASWATTREQVEALMKALDQTSTQFGETCQG